MSRKSKIFLKPFPPYFHIPVGFDFVPVVLCSFFLFFFFFFFGRVLQFEKLPLNASSVQEFSLPFLKPFSLKGYRYAIGDDFSD